MKDPYEILGVTPDASAEKVKQAYRRLARERHPDSDPGNPWAEEEFKELSAAYEYVANRAGASRQTSPPNRRPGSGKGGAKGGAKKSSKAGAGTSRAKDLKIKGANVEYVLRVDFMDAARGTTRHIDMASGKRLKVTVPPGTGHGRVLRLKGQGLAGFGGGADGDALVEVLVDPDPVFRTDGADIHVEVPVTLDEAVLGARIEAPTIDGTVTVTVPKGSNTGSRLRLKGRGLKTGERGGGPRGDQFVHLRVVLPKKPDKELIEFLEKWAPKRRYKVRGRKEP